MENELKFSGEFLGVEEAKGYLQAFLDSESASVAGEVTTSVVSGQVIGLENLKVFMAAIQTFNKDQQNTDKIEAVRVYYSRSKRKEASKVMRDIILEPVLASGMDLHKLFPHQIADDQLILGKAIPCPNLCSVAFNLDCQ